MVRAGPKNPPNKIWMGRAFFLDVIQFKHAFRARVPGMRRV